MVVYGPDSGLASIVGIQPGLSQISDQAFLEMPWSCWYGSFRLWVKACVGRSNKTGSGLIRPVKK